MAGTLWVGNLTFELDEGVKRPQPSIARQRLSAIATLLRAEAAEGDLLWTPLAVAPERVPAVDEFPNVRFVSGPLVAATGGIDVTGVTGVAAWAESDAVARVRVALGVPAVDGLPGVVRRVHDRSFQLDVAGALGLALPGATWVDSMSALEAHLAAGGADAGDGHWIVKHPFSAAGRERIRGRDGRLPEGGLRRRLGRLFEASGRGLVFEPWMERVADYGIAAWVGDGGTTVEAPHRLTVDGYGRFLALSRGGDLIPDDTARALRETVRAVGAQLETAGYRGPFGVDAWAYRTPGGVRLHPLGEINARRTIGHLAAAMEHRWAASGRLRPGATWRLAFEAAPPWDPAPDRRLRLLAGGPDSAEVVAEFRDVESRGGEGSKSPV